MMALTLQESLAILEQAAAEYQARKKEDLDCWVRWGHALNDHRDAYKREKKKDISRKEMKAICKKLFRRSAATGYRWIAFATHEPRIRQRLKEQNRESAEQGEMLDWISEWEGKPKNSQDRAANDQPPCPLCEQKMGKALAKKVAARLPTANGQTKVPEQGPPPKEDSVLLKLTKTRDWLDLCYEQMTHIDWSREDGIGCMKMIDELFLSLDNINSEVHDHVVIRKVS